MPVNLYEQSAFSGQPIMLYEFIRTSGATTVRWHYTNADRDIKYNTNTYLAVPISDGGIRLSSEAASTEFNVTMPIQSDFCTSFRLAGAVPSDSVYLRVRRSHAGEVVGIDGDAPEIVNDALVVWVGTVNGITQIDELQGRVSCAMLSASLKRGGLRYGYQKNCPHVLYAPNSCKVDKELFRVTGVVTAIDGFTVSADEFAIQPDGWFNGGFIEYALPDGLMERRMITLHTTTDVTLISFPAGLVVGATVAVFPGCDRTVDTCVAKFNNLANYGGFPHSPGRNPFDGQPLFDWWFVPLLALASLAEWL